MHIDQSGARSSSGRKRKDGRGLIEVEVGNPGPGRPCGTPSHSLLDAHHHRLPLFSTTEPRGFYAGFLCYEADICFISVSTKKSRRSPKETTR